jgi:hypothetical protein
MQGYCTQSISLLYAELGFGEKHPNRPGVAVLEAKLQYVDTSSLSQGSPKPCNRPSIQGYALAIPFCEQWGSDLWPKDLGPAPSWPEDTLMYISLLSLISGTKSNNVRILWLIVQLLSVKAWGNYQKQRRQPARYPIPRRQQGAWYGNLEQYLEAWKGTCAFCLIHNLADARHSINECLHDGKQAVWDKCAILQEELPKEGYSGCRLCYVPLKICHHWEFNDRIGWTESGTKICQFSGLVIPVVATLLVENDAGRISNLFDIADIRDDLNQTSEGIFRWLRQRWGDTGASWSIQLFCKVSAILNMESQTDASTALRTLRGKDFAKMDLVQLKSYSKIWMESQSYRIE